MEVQAINSCKDTYFDCVNQCYGQGHDYAYCGPATCEISSNQCESAANTRFNQCISCCTSLQHNHCQTNSPLETLDACCMTAANACYIWRETS
jgi:hypothetical protein